MAVSESHSPEIPASAGKDEAAKAKEALVEQKRQLVRDILAGKPETVVVPADLVPDTTPVELVDSANRQQLADARQAVIDALEMVPVAPSLPKDVSLN